MSKNSTMKNLLHMIYDGKIRNITDKCILLPDNSLFNIETHEIKKLNDIIYRISGYNNMKFMYAISNGKRILYNNIGDEILVFDNNCVKPKIYRISSCEYVIVNKDTIYVYNYNIKAITKQINYMRIYVDELKSKLSVVYIEDNKLNKILLDIL